jgi:feruloyl esterase
VISKKHVLTIGAILFGLVLLNAGPAFCGPDEGSCVALKAYIAGLTDEEFGLPVTNVTAQWNGNNAAASYCQVTGWIWPEIQFQVTLPTDWNNRYVNRGGGGWDGSLSSPGGPDPEGYAESSANGGYTGSNWPGECGSFGLKEPYFSAYYDAGAYPTGAGGSYNYAEAGLAEPAAGNPYACEKVYDFGIRHLRETPRIAKEIIKHYYGSYPMYSYFSGGSCGGKEGQISAQLFPELYDGFFIAYPLGGHLAVTFRGVWDTLWGAELAKQTDPDCTGWGCASVYSQYKAQLHYETVYGKCDAVDGLEDGVIDDPTKCEFDAMTDLPACTPEEEAVEGVDGVYASTCFTHAQRQALKEIYAGPHDSRGNAWFPGQPLSAEYMASGWAGLSSGFGAALSDGWAPCMFANIALDPPDGPSFDINNFDWDVDPVLMQQTTCQASNGATYNIHDTLDGITISPQPDFNMGGLEAVYAKGAKIVQTHGWSDALVTPLAGSLGPYETALQNMGVEKTKRFWKLYMVPGGGHGVGGLSAWPANTDAFRAMVDWVENGIEPGAIIGSRNANVDPNYPDPRTRPNCPYPEVARYSGSGSIDDAANFMCVPPIEVSIKPKTINLKKKGVVTAFITVPEGYDFEDWNIGDLTCEGAPTIEEKLTKNKYIAKFRAQDFVGIEPGQKVELTVKGTFSPDDSRVALIQASDKVRVMGK